MPLSETSLVASSTRSIISSPKFVKTATQVSQEFLQFINSE